MAKRGFIFNSVRLRKPKRNAFNLSYENKLTCNMGSLIPFCNIEVLPHDTLKVGQEYLMRCQPLIAPLMHRVDVYQHYFFVPYRLIWDNFEKFITGGETGTETAVHPYITPLDIWNTQGGTGNNKNGTLFDYLGYPTSVGIHGTPDNTLHLNSLRIRAYNLIWNEYYRDQNLQEEVKINKDDGHDTRSNTNFNILRRAWKKDYFTSALPFQQRGPSVFLPYSGGNVTLGPADPSISTQQIKVWDEQSGTWKVKQGIANLTSGAYDLRPGASGVPETYQFQPGMLGADGSGEVVTPSQLNPAIFDPNGTLKVDDIQIPINELRRANALQRWFEKNARAGSRYVEQILSHFGIHPSDYRLQRPLYLGGGRQPFSISDVVQVSSTDSTSPQGNLSGKGYASNAQYVFKKTFEEHGIVIGLLSIMPRSSYQQGLNRMLTKTDKFDYAFPEFGNLGEQEVLNRELYFDPTDSATSDNNAVFGYQSRYAEYKYNHDEVHGDFKDTLSFWHMGRIFNNRPLLNSSFIESDPTDRVFAVADSESDNPTHHLLFDFYNNIEVLRCLPAYGTPSL